MTIAPLRARVVLGVCLLWSIIISSLPSMTSKQWESPPPHHNCTQQAWAYAYKWQQGLKMTRLEPQVHFYSFLYILSTNNYLWILCQIEYTEQQQGFETMRLDPLVSYVYRTGQWQWRIPGWWTGIEGGSRCDHLKYLVHFFFFLFS